MMMRQATKMLMWSMGLMLLRGVYGQRITGLTLVDTQTNSAISSLVDGDVIDLVDVGLFLTIRAEVDDPDKIRNVILNMDDKVERTDAFPPFALGGDTNVPVSAITRYGSHTITATATSNDGSSVDNDSLTVTFVIINGDQSMSPSAAPLVGASDVPPYNASPNGALTGELKKWHKITIGFLGPLTGEHTDAREIFRNAFSGYRLDVTFAHPETSKEYVVPGYFAADGNAANTGARVGQVWLVHFCPDETGVWNYIASFTEGDNVAQNGGGTPLYFDGATGSFSVAETDKTGRDLRGKGRLQYVGQHYLRFAETGEWFLKAGADSPENLLAYQDFDNTPNNNGFRKTWAPHEQDYREGDPTWALGKGKGLIGAINYLSNKGMNAFSFLTLNIGGDDQNVFPYVSDLPKDRNRIDVSKTAQWEVIFEHADHMGMFLHFKTQEQEMDQLLDEGELGLERKLYYRELIARFGHHLALNWNIGEENTNTDFQRKVFSEYFKEIDPYDHPVVVHTFPNEKELVYRPILGNKNFNGVSLQSSPGLVFKDTLKWVTESAAAGQKWVVANDEQNPATKGVLPDAVKPRHNKIRKQVLWGNLMAGGAGVEYYFGYKYNNSDLTCEDFRSRDVMWDQTRVALEFFHDNAIPYWNMTNADELVSPEGNHALMDTNGAIMVIYFNQGNEVSVDLSKFSGRTYSIQWYDPRVGGGLFDGPVKSFESASSFKIQGLEVGNDDWAILLRCQNCPESSQVLDLTGTAAPTPIATLTPVPSRSASQSPSQWFLPVPTPTPNTVPAPSLSPSLIPFPTYSESSDLPSDVPSDLLSDVPSDLPTNVPSQVPSDVESLVVTMTTSDRPAAESPTSDIGDIASAVPTMNTVGKVDPLATATDGSELPNTSSVVRALPLHSVLVLSSMVLWIIT